jgi:hypothetical protein
MSYRFNQRVIDFFKVRLPALIYCLAGAVGGKGFLNKKSPP